MSSTLVFGSTGAVGAHVLKEIVAHNSFPTIHSITRRAPATTSAKLNSIVDEDSSTWASKIATLTPRVTAVISGLGTTAAEAGGIANQWKIDHDLNVEIARAAKAADVESFVFISSAGAGSFVTAVSPYLKMKKGVETTITELGFKNAIIVRPRMIMGEREKSHGAAAWLIKSTILLLGRVSQSAQDAWGQDKEVIARAAVRALELANEGRAPSNPWILEYSDILRLGRTEWNATV